MTHILINGKVIYFDITKPCPLITEGIQIHGGEPDNSLYWWRSPWYYIGNKTPKWLLVRIVRHRVIYIEYKDKHLLSFLKKTKIDKKWLDTLYTSVKPKEAITISGTRVLSGSFQDEKSQYSQITGLELHRIFRYVNRK